MYMLFPRVNSTVRQCLEEPLLSVRQFTEVKVLLRVHRRRVS